MKTTRDDDYLICKHYYNNIDKINKDYPEFITFQHKDNWFFAWVNDGKVILRSEAYPDYERCERGIKAILKNRDIYERYSIDSQHGAHFLVLWGGGDHQKHTGNMDKHNEIGRSCPVKDKAELYALMGFMGDDFVNGVFHWDKKKVVKEVKKKSKKKGAAVAGTAAAAAMAASSKPEKKVTRREEPVKRKEAAVATTTRKEDNNNGGGFNWWWLLPLLLLPLLFFLWKGCNKEKAAPAAVKTEKVAPKKEVAAPVVDEAKLAEEARLKAEAEERVRAEAEAKRKAEVAAAQKEREMERARARRASTSGNKASGY